MSKKRASDEEINTLLNLPGFGQGSQPMSPPADVTPITALTLPLNLDQIKPYDKNPRRERNPRYDEIKASILAKKGLNNPLNVTKRPGDKCYMIEAGGNTRFEILQELWQETGDEAFYYVKVQFNPWVSETHVLAAHMIENELRGEMSLLSKALGLGELKKQLQEEGNTSLNRSQFVSKLKTIGYTVSRRQIIRMEYLAERLYPLIPSSAPNINLRHVDQIRSTEKAYLEFWTKQFGDDTNRFSLLFEERLNARDKNWDLDALRNDLDRRISDLCDISLDQVRMEVDAIRYNSTGPTIRSQENSTQISGSGEIEPPSSAQKKPVQKTDPSLKQSGKPMPPPVKDSYTETPPVTKHKPSQKRDKLSDNNMSLNAYNGPTDLKSLRARNITLALKITQRHGLSECLRTIPMGMGFLMDLPEKFFQVDEPTAGTGPDALRQFLWWMLHAASEVIDGNEANGVQRAQRSLDSSMRMLEPVKTDGAPAIQAIAGDPPHLGIIAYRFLSNPDGLDQPTFNDLLLLLENCRRIRLGAEDPGDMRLWE